MAQPSVVQNLYAELNKFRNNQEYDKALKIANKRMIFDIFVNIRRKLTNYKKGLYRYFNYLAYHISLLVLSIYLHHCHNSDYYVL